MEMKIAVMVEFTVYEAGGRAMARPGQVTLSVTDATAAQVESVQGSQEVQTILLECACECITRKLNRPPDLVEGANILKKGMANA